ncbi:MAG: hypothetical protein QF752_17080 [Planctomycetota bacterium]|jgi:hypothetical protein|nr:hypothetical protein [Planctomycetota bacterium]
MKRRNYFQLILWIATLALGVTTLGCSSTTPRRNPTGEKFPQVRGDSLAGKPFVIPDDLLGQPVLLLVGYLQESQFDLDRWILGLLQTKTPIRIFELPTIPSRIASLFKRTIDSGMRDGIPQEDWAIVITLWADQADRIVAMTGNEKSRNTRVFLLDAEGNIVWYTDRGYSGSQLLALDQKVREMKVASQATPNE